VPLFIGDFTREPRDTLRATLFIAHIAQEITHGLDVRRLSATEKRARVAEALAIVQMERFADR